MCCDRVIYFGEFDIYIYEWLMIGYVGLLVFLLLIVM